MRDGTVVNTPEDAEPLSPAMLIGSRIRRFRAERGLSLTQLADLADVSKSHLSVVENGSGTRPGASVLHRIAVALGVTIADLLGRTVAADAVTAISDSLSDFARERRLPQADVDMLAGIAFRGTPPRTSQRWAYIYDAIRMSASLDPAPPPAES